MWAGDVADRLIGPYMLPQRLNGQTYLTILWKVLPELLEEVPLMCRQRMWFQHDGAPAPSCWNPWEGVGLEAVVQSGLPARSTDFTPLDFFMWGHMKSFIYTTPAESEDALVSRIAAAAEQIMTMPGVFHRMTRNMVCRCIACIECGGSTFEQLL